LQIFGFISGGIGGIYIGVKFSEEESIHKQLVISTGTGILGAATGILFFNPIIAPFMFISGIFVFSNKILYQKK